MSLKSLFIALALIFALAVAQDENVPLATLSVRAGTATESVVAGAGVAAKQSVFVENTADVDASSVTVTATCTSESGVAERAVALTSLSIGKETGSSASFAGESASIKSALPAQTTKEFIVDFTAGPAVADKDSIECTFAVASGADAEVNGPAERSLSTSVSRFVYIELFTTFDIVDGVFQAGLRVVNNGPSDASGAVVSATYTFATEGNKLVGTVPKTEIVDALIPNYALDVQAGSEATYVALFSTSSCNGVDAVFEWVLESTAEEQDARTDQLVVGKPAFADEFIDISVSVTAVNPNGEGPFIAGSGLGNVVFETTVRNLNKQFCATDVEIDFSLAYASRGFDARFPTFVLNNNPEATFLDWIDDAVKQEQSGFMRLPTLLPGSAVVVRTGVTADSAAKPGEDVATFTAQYASSIQPDTNAENDVASSTVSLFGAPNLQLAAFGEKSALAGGNQDILDAFGGPPAARKKKRNAGGNRDFVAIDSTWKRVVADSEGNVYESAEGADEQVQKLFGASPAALFPFDTEDGLLLQEFAVTNVEDPNNAYIFAATDVRTVVRSRFPANAGRIRRFVTFFTTSTSTTEFKNGPDDTFTITIDEPTLQPGQLTGTVMMFSVEADVLQCERCLRSVATVVGGKSFPYQAFGLRQTDDDAAALVASFTRESEIRLSWEQVDLKQHGRERQIKVKAYNAGPSDVQAAAYKQSITLPSDAKIVDMFAHHGVLQGHVEGSRHNLDERLWAVPLVAGGEAAELHIRTRNQKKNPGTLTYAGRIDTSNTDERVLGNEAALRFDIEL